MPGKTHLSICQILT